MSLIAWLPLNGNLSNQGLGNITTSGTPSYSTGNICSQALDLSKRINFTIADLAGATKFSIAFWYKVNPDQNLSTNWVDVLAVRAKSADETKTVDFRFETGYGNAIIGIGGYDAGSNSVIGDTNANTLVQDQDSKWHHICVIANDSTTKVRWFVDGIEKANRNYVGGHLTGEGWLGETDKVNGSIQDVRFYNHVLSKKEIKELAKGLCLHLPLDWGGNPNMIKNSYTWMNKNTASHNSNSCTVTKSVIQDTTAPCNWVYKCVMNNANDSNKSSVGGFFSMTNQGLTASDLTSGETYTYSFWAKADSLNTADISLASGSVCEGQTKLSDSGFGNLTTGWRKHTVTFNWTNTSKLTACFYVTMPANSTQTYYLCGLKLEKGNKATPYIPNVEESIYISNGYGTKYLQDCSGYNKSITYLGEPISNSGSCRGNSCTYFDGSDDGITFTDADMYKIIGNPHTISFWINSQDNGGRSIYFSHYIGSGWSMALEKTTGNVLRYYWSGNPDYNNTSFTISDNEWIHICVVRESETSTKFYKNGTLVNTYTTSCATPTSGSPTWYLGRDTRTGSTCYKGTMSDFRLYATALSADDVKELYNIAGQIDKSGNIYCSSFIEE